MEQLLGVDLLKIFDALLHGEETREAISKSVNLIRIKIEKNQMIIVEIREEESIWNAILFLEGIDLPDDGDEYLFSKKDISWYLEKLKIRLGLPS